MKLSQRIFIAAAIIAIEAVTVFIPVLAIYAAYLLVARPPWFKVWIEGVYRTAGK